MRVRTPKLIRVDCCYFDGREVYLLDFPYLARTNSFIKSVINQLRKLYVKRTRNASLLAGGWDPRLRHWYIAQEIWLEFKQNMEREEYIFTWDNGNYHEQGTHYEGRGYYQSEQTSSTTGKSKLNLFTDWLGIDQNNEILLNSSYRDIALIIHPDRQSNEKLKNLAEELMKRVNADFDQFRKARAS